MRAAGRLATLGGMPADDRTRQLRRLADAGDEEREEERRAPDAASLDLALARFRTTARSLRRRDVVAEAEATSSLAPRPGRGSP